MRTVSVRVVKGSGLREDKSVYCEVEFRDQTHRTSTRKGNTCDWDQQFPLGQFHLTDGLGFRIISKRSKRVLGEAIIPLERFARPGLYDETLPLGDGQTIAICIITEASGRAFTRTASVKIIGRRLRDLMGSSSDVVSLSSSTPTVPLDVPHSEETPKEERRRRKVSKKKTRLATSPPEQGGDEGDGESIPLRRNHRRSKATRRRSTHEVNTDLVPLPDVPLSSSPSSGKALPRGKSPRPTLEQLKGTTTPLPLPADSANVVEPGTVRVVLKPLGETSTQNFFGTPLEEVLSHQRQKRPELDIDIPFFFYEAGKAVRLHGTSVKGIFRIRGKIKEVKELKQKIDAGEEIGQEVWSNIHLITTLMKAFLRELPEPILHFENYDTFIHVDGLSSVEDKIDALQKLIFSLPQSNYALLSFLFSLLHDLSCNAEETQMNAENLAKVISPNLIWKEILDITDVSVVEDALKGNRIAEVMIVHYDQLFKQENAGADS